MRTPSGPSFSPSQSRQPPLLEWVSSSFPHPLFGVQTRHCRFYPSSLPPAAETPRVRVGAPVLPSPYRGRGPGEPGGPGAWCTKLYVPGRTARSLEGLGGCATNVGSSWYYWCWLPWEPFGAVRCRRPAVSITCHRRARRDSSSGLRQEPDRGSAVTLLGRGRPRDPRLRWVGSGYRCLSSLVSAFRALPTCPPTCAGAPHLRAAKGTK